MEKYNKTNQVQIFNSYESSIMKIAKQEPISLTFHTSNL